LDRFYLEQRVRNFIANGLQLYGESSRWRAPFLGREWTRLVWQLPRAWKLGSKWHRFAIWRNEPRLLNFPEEGLGHNMTKSIPWLYWSGVRRRVPIVGYADYRGWFAHGCLADYLMDRAERLGAIIAPATVRAIVAQQRRHASRTRVLSFLLSLIHWMDRVDAATNPSQT